MVSDDELRAPPSSATTRFGAYLSLLRIDHWFKNIFALPGALLALRIEPHTERLPALPVMLAALCLVASANYVLNEWLDAPYDRHHPEKQHRAASRLTLSPIVASVLYVTCLSVGLVLSWWVNGRALMTASALAVMGLLYNVPPIRTKELPYVDVLSEAINNPIRLLCGWFALLPHALPPVSIVIAYWFGGAFLMGAKRFSEYRFIGDPKRAALYRRSFRHYDEKRLLVSSVFYGMCSTMFLGVFLIKHNVELVISFPFLALLFVWYLSLAFDRDSVVQHPEKMYRNWRFVLFAAFVAALVCALLFVDVPILDWFRGGMTRRWMRQGGP